MALRYKGTGKFMGSLFKREKEAEEADISKKAPIVEEEKDKGVTATDKMDIITSLLESGFNLEQNLLEGEVGKTVSLANELAQVYRSNVEEIDGKDFEDEAFFQRIQGKTPEEISDIVLEDIPYTPETLTSFVTQLNESKASPYKAKVVELGKDEWGWGWFKEIDSYQRSSDGRGNPLYFRFYKDGSYDQLDAATFNKEKRFNHLPDRIKNMVSLPLYAVKSRKKT